MKKHLITVLVIIAALLASVAIAQVVRQQAPQEAAVALPVEYRSEEHKFTLHFPEGWTQLENDGNDAKLIASFASPKLKAAPDAGASMTIVRYPSVNDFADSLTAGEKHPEFKSLTLSATWQVNEIGKNPSMPRETEIFRHAIFADQPGYEVLVRQENGIAHGVVFLEDGAVYRILFDASEMGDPLTLSSEQWAILNSLKFDPKSDAQPAS